jgi:hypothetical protein
MEHNYPTKAAGVCNRRRACKHLHRHICLKSASGEDTPSMGMSTDNIGPLRPRPFGGIYADVSADVCEAKARTTLLTNGN